GGGRPRSGGGPPRERRRRAPAGADRPIKERFGVEVASDDAAAGEQLRLALIDQGYRVDAVTALDREAPGRPRFQLHPGPFTGEKGAGEVARLQKIVEQVVGARGIDAKRFPLETTTRREGGAARLVLPVHCCSSPGARPYAGPFPQRFEVVLHTDEPESTVVAGLRQALREAGFALVRTEAAPSLLDRPDAETPPGLRVHWASAGRET